MAIAVGPWNDKYEVPDPVEEIPAATNETPEQVSSEVTPTEVQTEIPPVETPAAEVITEPVETPTEEVITPQPEVKEVIKEVEKIVEKYPEMDEYTQTMFDAIMEGKEDVLLNYLSDKHKDYKTMSDYDVVKENLKKSNPTWTAQEVDLEIAYKYGDKLAKIDLNNIDKDLDPDDYKDAVRHNREVEQNEILLKRDARDARIALEQSKKDIKLPKIEKVSVEPVVTGPTKEELEARETEWQTRITQEIPNLKEFSFKVGDKDSGYEDVVYNITDAQRLEQTAFLKDLDLNKMVTRLGWLDKDGRENISKIAGDVLKLENVAQLIQSAYTQGKTTGSKGVIGEIKNIDLKPNNPQSVQATPPDLGSLVWGRLNPK